MKGEQVAGSITDFEYIVEAMPFPTYQEKLVYAVLFCRKLQGIRLAIPKKQNERSLAEELFKNGISFSDVKEITFLHDKTLQKILKEVKHEQKKRSN
jgi:hypothetical protein